MRTRDKKDKNQNYRLNSGTNTKPIIYEMRYYIMNIKQLIPVTSDFAVLATRKSDFTKPCYDQQGDGHSFFWAVIDGGYEDRIELIDVGLVNSQRICECRLVVPRKSCPICNPQMEPVYENGHEPIFCQECPACGFVYDMRSHDTTD